MPPLPEGTVTLLFTDVEGSTRVLQALGREKYAQALEEHRALLRSAFAARGGVEVEMLGDSFHFAFAYARDAVAAAAEGQRALAAHSWIDMPIRVRIGVHTGEPMQVGGLYTGVDVHRAARVMDAGHGGQILLTPRTAGLVEGELPSATALSTRGSYLLKDFDGSLELFELVLGEDEASYPPLRAQPEHAPKRRRRTLVAGVAAAAVMAAAGALYVVTGDGASSAPMITPNSLVLLEPDTLETRDVVKLGTAPSRVRAGDDATYVLDADDMTVSRINPGSHEVRTVSVGLNPTSLAVSPESLWVSDGSTGTIARVNLETLLVEDTIDQPRIRGQGHQSGVFGQLALSGDTLWVTNRDRTLTKFDASRGHVTDRTRIGALGPIPTAIVADEAGVWLGGFGRIQRISPESGRIVAEVELTFDDISAIAVGARAVWATIPGTDTLWQIDPDTNRAQRPIQIVGGPSALAVEDDAIWVGTTTGTLIRVSPDSGHSTATADLGRSIRDIAVAPEGIWLVVQ